jgi:hypothetical protein
MSAAARCGAVVSNAEATPRRYISCLQAQRTEGRYRALAPALSGAHAAERAGRAEAEQKICCAVVVVVSVNRE